MNASILQPYMDDARKHFGQDAKITIRMKLELDQQVDGTFALEEPIWSCAVDVGEVDGCWKPFRGTSIEEALEKAKAEYKKPDRARIAAAAKLKQQAEAILDGTAPIPE